MDRNPWPRRAGIALVLGPLVFIAGMGVEQSLRPGFSDIHDTISELGTDSHGWSFAWIFAASAVLTGFLTLLAAYALIPTLGRRGRSGAVALALAGVGYVGVGALDMDVYFALHSLFALDQFVMSGVAVFLIGPVVGITGRFGPACTPFSRICGVVTLGSLVLFVAGVGGKDYAGLVERFVVAPVLLWSIVIGLALIRSPGKPPGSRRPDGSLGSSRPGHRPTDTRSGADPAPSAPD